MDSLFTDIDVLKVTFSSCPVQESLGILGRKWTLLVLRNIGLYRVQRFNEMLKITPGLTKRVLSMRLKELEKEQFIQVIDRKQNFTKWDLTEKGKDSLTILMVLAQFGTKYYSSKVFKDHKPRNLNDVFELSYIQEILSRLLPDNYLFDSYSRNKFEERSQTQTLAPETISNVSK